MRLNGTRFARSLQGGVFVRPCRATEKQPKDKDGMTYVQSISGYIRSSYISGRYITGRFSIDTLYSISSQPRSSSGIQSAKSPIRRN